MPQLQKTTKEERLAQLATEIAEHQHVIDQRKIILKNLEAQVRDLLGDFTKDVPAGSLKIDWTPPKRSFQTAEFIAAYPPETNPHMYKLVPDSGMIPAKLKENFMRRDAGEGTVKIK